MKQKNLNYDRELILKKAVFNAANLWEISNKQLAKIVGMSEATISRLHSNTTKGINPASKEGELALLFVRTFRSLDAFLGNVVDNERKWLNAPNRALNGAPIERMQTVEGLVAVVRYLDAIRGKV